MTKYILNNDDVIRLDNKLFQYKDLQPYAQEIPNSIDYSEKHPDTIDEIFKHGNDEDTIELKQGDIVKPFHDAYVEEMLIQGELVSIPDLKLALKQKKASNSKVINLTPTKPTENQKIEYQKNCKELEQQENDISNLVDSATNEGTSYYEGVAYGTAHQWREVAETALSLANIQEAINRYEDRFSKD